MIWNKKSGMIKLLRLFIVSFLIFCLCVETPLCDLGTSRALREEEEEAEEGVEYVSDVRLFYCLDSMEGAVNLCQSSGFTPVVSDLNAGAERNFVVMGYKTTDKRSEAICSIRLLGMHDGFDLKDYSELQEQYKQSNASKIDIAYSAALEFTANYEAKAPKALEAYDGLNLIHVPEAGDELLGDYIVSGEADWDFFATLLTQASSGTVNAVLSYLSFGLSAYENEVDNDGDVVTMNWAEMVKDSVLWDEIDGTLTQDEKDDLYKEYGDDAAAFHKKLQEFASAYDDAVAEFSQARFIDNMERLEDKDSGEIVEQTEEVIDKDSVGAAYITMYKTLDNYEAYSGYPLGEYLLDLGYQTSEQVDLTKLYPIIDCMSYAQRRLAGIGGISALIMNLGANEENGEVVEKTSEVRDHLEELLGTGSYSIWMNTNQELQDKKVAYTSDAVRTTKAGTLIDSYDPTTNKQEVDEVMTWVNMGLGVLSAVVLMASFGWFATALAAVVMIIAAPILAVIAIVTGGISLASTLSTIAGALTVASGPLGLVLTAVTIILSVGVWLYGVIDDYIRENSDVDYDDAPDYVADQSRGANGEYIAFYKGVGSEEVAGEDYDEDDHHGVEGMSDVNGRMGFRGWVCMYSSKDPNTGSPIVVTPGQDVFTVMHGSDFSVKGLQPVSFFGEVTAGNCNSFMKKDNVNGIYIYYRTLDSGKGIDEDEIGATSAVSGSAASGSATSKAELNLNGKQYIKDIIVRSADSEDKAKAKIKIKGNFNIWDHNISNDTRFNYSYKKNHAFTYIGYSVTTDPRQAVTDIRVAPFYNSSEGKEMFFGSVKYGCAGTLGFFAENSTEVDKDNTYPEDLDGLWFTTNDNAGTPIEVNGLHLVSGHKDATTGVSFADKGWVPVTTFSGVPYNFASTRVSDTKSWQPGRVGNYGYNYTAYQTDTDYTWNCPHRYIYYEPQKQYTSGTKYLSGVFFTFGTDSEDTKAKSGETWAKVSELNECMQENPRAVLDTGHNLASSYYYEGFVVESEQKYLYMGYTWSYNPYRALTDIRAFQGTTLCSTLPYNISKAKSYSGNAAAAADSQTSYAAVTVVSQRTAGDGKWVSRGLGPENAYMTSTGLLGTNEQVPKGYTTGYKPGGYNYGGDKVPFIATGLYVSGAMTGAEGEKLTLNDVVITTNRHVAANYDGDISTNLSGESTLGGKAAEGTFHSVQDMKNPYELEPFNIAYPTWTNDDGDKYNATCTYYMYVRGQYHKPKYISKIFVGAYSVEDYAPDKRDEDVDKEVAKQVDLNALVSANGAASDEVIPANIAAERNITWYAGTINYGCRNYDSIRTKRGRYLQPDDKMIKDEYVVPYKPHKISARKSGSGTEDTFTPAAYMSVARTDNEADAIKGIVLFKTDKDMVPELIQLEGVDYWCASPTVPIRMKINKPTDDGWARFETYKYFLYYTRNKGVAPGQPIMELSADDDIFNSGMVTALCTDKADSKGKGDDSTARPYGEANMAQFVHATYRKTNRMYFNKVFTASGDTRREALAGLLEQGCTEFLDMDLNNGVSLTDEDIDEDEDKTGGKNVYFGFRGYTLDEDKIKEIVNKDAQEREKQSQMQEAIYDIICTVGEPYHPEGIVTDKYQIYYSPVSKLDSNDNLVGTNLNDGTDAPEIYMYYTTVWAAEQYNNKVGTDTRKNLSSMPNDIFGSPLTRLCFTTYDRIPYNGNGTGTNANPADNDKKWEYVMYKDSTEPVDFNDGAIKLDTDLHIQNTRVTMFAQRENGKPKPSAEITGGYTSSTTEFSSLFIKMDD